MLRVENLGVSFGQSKILRGIDFEIGENDWLMIIGPNGAGKTTITNAIAQGVAYTGDIYLDGKDLRTMRAKDRARLLGVLMQAHYVAYSYSVKEVVALGNYARAGGIFEKDPLGQAEVEKALEATGLKGYQDRSVLSLSGGELQRVFLSQILLQDPRLMILDEPTNHLDLVYQEAIFNLVDKWKEKEGRSVISVVHDLKLARMFGTKVLLIKDGQVYAYGPTEEVMTRENLQAVYSMDVYGWMEKLNRNW